MNLPGKKWFYGGIGLVLALILAESVLFWKESIFFCDAPVSYFDFINKRWFALAQDRYGMAVAQVLPLLALKAGWSLKHIFILQSVSYGLHFIATIAFLAFYMRDRFHAAMACLWFAYGTIDVHFVKIWEIYYAMNYALIFSSILRQALPSLKSYIALLIFSALAIVTHPSTLCFLAVSVLAWRQNLSWKKISGFMIWAVAVLGLSVIGDDYEQGRLGTSFTLKADYTSVLQYLRVAFMSFPVAFAIITAAASLIIYKSSAKRWILTLLIVIPFLIVASNLVSSFDFSEAHYFYFEGNMLIGFFALSFFALANMNRFRYVASIVLMIALVRILFLNIPGHKYNEGIEASENLISALSEQYPNGKVFILNPAHGHPLPEEWIIHHYHKESFLLSSSMDGTRPISVYFTNDTTTYHENESVVFVNALEPVVDIKDPKTYYNPFYPSEMFGYIKPETDIVKL